MTQAQRLRLSLHFQFSSYIATYNNYSMICGRLASFQATHLNRLHNLQIKPAMSLILFNKLMQNKLKNAAVYAF